MQRVFALSILLITAFTVGLTGCGNKGPLYLPPEPVQQTTPVQQETTEAEDESSEATEPDDDEEPETTEAE